MRFGIAKSGMRFPLVSALSFHYLCQYEDRMRLGIAKSGMRFPLVSPPDPLPLQPFPAICSVRRLSQRGLRPPHGPLRPSSVSFQTRPLRIPSSRGNHRRPRKQELSRSGRICSRQAACLPYRPLPSPKVTGKTRKARPPRS